MNLKAYQAQFLQFLQEGASSDWTFKNCTKAEITERFSIYRDSITGNNFKALQNIFPSMMRLVGSEYFEYVARLYLAAYQNTESILDNVGKDFAEFLRKQNSVIEILPYLPDFALLEWRWHRVLHGLNNAALPSYSFEMVAKQGKKVFLPLNAQRIVSAYPIFQYWKFSQPDYAGNFILMPETLPDRLLLFQRDHAIHLKKITSEKEWALLMSLQEPQKIFYQEASFDRLQSLWERGCLQIV